LTTSGSHTFAIYILLSGQLQPHFQVLMGLGWDELKLTNPVRPGDALNLEMTVLELRPSKSKSDWGIVRNRNLLQSKARDGAGMHFHHFRCVANGGELSTSR
jgi:acyl dehydratase